MTVQDHIDSMKRMAKLLIPKSHPSVPASDEEILVPLKQREISIDGYDVVVYYSISRYSNGDVETLQIYGKYFTFLPFILVCKVARAFLGTKNLTLTEIMNFRQAGVANEYARKIYVWNLYRRGDDPVEPPFEAAKGDSYGDFSFYRVDQNQFAIRNL